MNSAILFVYRTEYAYGKEPEGSQKVLFSPFSAGWDSKALEQNQFCLDLMYFIVKVGKHGMFNGGEWMLRKFFVTLKPLPFHVLYVK